MPTHHKGTESETRALNAFIKLMRATESVSSRLTNILQGEGLTISQFGVLEALLHLGPLSLRQIGEKILKSGGNITTVVDNLEKHDLVERRRCPEDRRVIYAHLTEKGEKLIANYFPKHLKEIEREMNTLSPSELEELGRLCKKLGLGSQN
jgi:MarR family transcriptional regulator, 2-MHQ and catechol-resistance regulon repressor